VSHVGAGIDAEFDQTGQYVGVTYVTADVFSQYIALGRALLQRQMSQLGVKQYRSAAGDRWCRLVYSIYDIQPGYQSPLKLSSLYAVS